MDINALIQTLQSALPQIAESCCIVNGALMTLTEVQNMGYDEFSMRAKMNMPLKLYKYFCLLYTSLRLAAEAGDPEAIAQYEQHLSKLRERNQKYRQKVREARCV